MRIDILNLVGIDPAITQRIHNATARTIAIGCGDVMRV